MTRQLHLVLAVVLGVLALALPARAQSTIELRSVARVAPGTALTLGQVAILTGPEAAELAGVPLATTSEQPGTISLEEVRHAIESHAKVNWGRISLRGSLCSIAAADPSTPAARPAATPAPTSESPTAKPGTLRLAVLERIYQLVDAAPDDVRAAFLAEDRDFLELPTAGRTIEVQPTGASDRLPLSIALYEGAHTVASRSIRVAVQVRRPVLIAKSAKHRGEIVTSDDVETDSRWVGPTAKPASREQTLGSAVQSRLAVGDVIMADDVGPVVSVNRGEIVTVRCISGTIVLRTRARAMAAGRDGDLIQFQALDSPRTFFARMDGKGSAVVLAGDAVPADTAAASRTASIRARRDRVAPPSQRALEATR
jgi:flagella basal body P-ring formation protein FlgA